MHRKIFIIDETQVFIGTANLTYQSLKMHDNLLIGMHQESLARFLTTCTDAHFAFNIAEQELELFLLPDFESPAVKKLVSLIEGARKKIQIAMFTLTHPLLTQKLIEAKRRGVDVQIAVDFYAGQGASRKILEEMMQEKIPIYLSRGEQLLHYKWAMIDGHYLVAGSANWTKAAFEKNQDCFLILEPLNEDQKQFVRHLWERISYESVEQIP
jgi:phosphatidylserine/phosphatidylglycerophosphate/cardiolipin synthase-like enzyme